MIACLLVADGSCRYGSSKLAGELYRTVEARGLGSVRGLVVCVFCLPLLAEAMILGVVVWCRVRNLMISSGRAVARKTKERVGESARGSPESQG